MIPQVSHYRIEGELGRDGMGIVYHAVDTRLGRRVAIKMLPAETTADPERHQRFVQEARAASALNHPNIVTIYEIGEDAGATFIAMELVEGTPLDKLLTGAPLPVAAAVEYAGQVAAALEAAHASGIVHRDIKPAHIVITRDGRAKVLERIARIRRVSPRVTEVPLIEPLDGPGDAASLPLLMSTSSAWRSTARCVLSGGPNPAHPASPVSRHPIAVSDSAHQSLLN